MRIKIKIKNKLKNIYKFFIELWNKKKINLTKKLKKNSMKQIKIKLKNHNIITNE